MAAVCGDLVFSESALSTKSFSFPINVEVDGKGSHVRIQFSDWVHTSAVALSDDCIALLRQDELTGFWLNVAP